MCIHIYIERGIIERKREKEGAYVVAILNHSRIQTRWYLNPQHSGPISGNKQRHNDNNWLADEIERTERNVCVCVYIYIYI